MTIATLEGVWLTVMNRTAGLDIFFLYFFSLFVVYFVFLLLNSFALVFICVPKFPTEMSFKKICCCSQFRRMLADSLSFFRFLSIPFDANGETFVRSSVVFFCLECVVGRCALCSSPSSLTHTVALPFHDRIAFSTSSSRTISSMDFPSTPCRTSTVCSPNSGGGRNNPVDSVHSWVP